MKVNFNASAAQARHDENRDAYQVAGPPPGTAVEFRNLMSRPTLNGVVGIVNGPPAADTGRYPVVAMIDGKLQEAFLQEKNLVPSSVPPEWYTPPDCACGRAHTPLDKEKACMPVRGGKPDEAPTPATLIGQNRALVGAVTAGVVVMTLAVVIAAVRRGRGSAG